MSPRALPHHEVHVWEAEIGAPPAEPERVLAPDERERATRFRTDRDRDRYVAARCLLRRILAGYLGCDPHEVRLRYGPTGKPELDEPWCGSGIAFNLSHTGDRVLVALARGRRVGIDMETVRPVPDAARIAGRVFPPTEHAGWLALPEGEREAGFVARWARLEAAAKLEGEGVWRMARRDPAEAGIVVLQIPAPEGCAAALAVEAGETTVRHFRGDGGEAAR